MILFKQSTIEGVKAINYFDVHISIFTIMEPLKASEARSVPRLVKL